MAAPASSGAAARGATEAPSRRLDPRSIVRAAVYIQAAVRRFLVEDAVQVLDISPPVPPPPVAVGLFFARRLRKPLSGRKLEDEAMGVAAIVCGMDRGLTLGPIVAAHEEYAERLPLEHPVLEMLRERFMEVAVEAEEELLRRLQDVETPSQGYAVVKQFGAEWGAPEQPLARRPGQQFFERAQAVIKSLKPAMEEKLTRNLDVCQTSAGFATLEAEIDRELGEGYPVLRTRLRNGRRAHRTHVENTAQSLWGWPPTGQCEPLARASRWYAAELGADHPVVEDFAAAVLRKIRKAEDSLRRELTPVDKRVVALREQLGGTFLPAKLVVDSLRAELNEQMVTALEMFRHWQQELGCESKVLFAFMRTTLGTEGFVKRCEEEAERAAEVLRRPDLGPFAGAHGAAEAEERLAASARLNQLQAALGSDAPAHLRALSAEFEPELARARPLVPLLVPGVPPETDDDGWHQPPGFQGVEATEAAAAAASGAVDVPRRQSAAGLTEMDPAEWEAVIAQAEEQKSTARASVEEEPAVSVRMRLHGVGVEDTRSKSEILLLERCAGIIAEECGIPREWVTHVAFAEPPPKPAPPAPVEEEAEEAGGGGDGTSGLAAGGPEAVPAGA